MNRTTVFHCQSLWGLLLLVVVPALLLALFAGEWGRRRPRSLDTLDPARTSNRGLGLLLVLSATGTLGGILACGWVLLFETDDPFQNPVFLGGLIMLGFVALLAAAALWLRGRATPVFVLASTPVLARIREGKPSWLRLLAPGLRLLSILLVIGALARPQVSTTEADVFTEGMDIVIVLDLSSTMEAVDFAPPERPRDAISRIEGAKEVIGSFIQQRKDDRLGLVVFSAEAFTQAPLTLDYTVIQNVLRSVRTRAIEDGTAIGDALMVAINRMRDSDVKSKVIILLTDGDDNMSKVAPIQAAEIAAEQEIKVFPILVGRGGRVPYPGEHDMLGRVVYQYAEVRTNPDLLKRIADIAHGEFYQAANQKALEEDLQDVLNRMEKSRLMDPGRFTRNTEVFQLLLLPALLLLLLELALRWTRFRTFP